MRAHKIALDPTPEQQDLFVEAGTGRARICTRER